MKMAALIDGGKRTNRKAEHGKELEKSHFVRLRHDGSRGLGDCA
jgi:hypothetical protein